MRGCSDAGSGENTVWGMEIVDGEVGKETCEAQNVIINQPFQIVIF